MIVSCCRHRHEEYCENHRHNHHRRCRHHPLHCCNHEAVVILISASASRHHDTYTVLFCCQHAAWGVVRAFKARKREEVSCAIQAYP